jgi:L-threonylcarbamoyladenylate synthase
MSQDIDLAVRILRRGGLVAFPTETVYGLGADATSAQGVGRIFAAKGRPSTNPLIVHIAGAKQARRYVTDWPPVAGLLADRFWPGPLTLVLPRAPQIVPAVSAGLDTVGLRCPRHPLALALLKAFDGAVAAPSANRSNRISPTTAQHVRDDLGASVDLVLDGGPCQVGIESTVLSLCTPVPTILRPGQISREDLLQVLPQVQMVAGLTAPSSPATSPGQQPLHYAPHSPCFRYHGPQLDPFLAQRRTQPIVILSLSAIHADPPHHVVPMPAQPEEYARQVYAALHAADEQQPRAILIEMPPDEPRWHAIRDRLLRASQPL